MNLLPLQNYRRTHFHASHESLRSSRSEQHRLYYPFKTQRGPTLPPSTSLCTISGENITTSYYPYKTPKLPTRTRTIYEALLFPPPRFLLPQLVEPRKRAAFAFRNILCILTSVVDTRVGRPSRRPANVEKSRLRVRGRIPAIFWAGVCARLLPMINARAETIGGRSCLSVQRCPVKQRWEGGP